MAEGKRRRAGMRRKLMLYFLFLVLLPVATLGVIGPLLYARSIEREASDHTARMIGQVATGIEDRVQEVERLIDMIAGMEDAAAFFRGGKGAAAAKATLPKLLSAAVGSHPGIAGVILVAEDADWVSQGFYRVTRDPLTSEEWYAVSREAPGGVRLIPRPAGRNIRSTGATGPDEVLAVVKSVVGVDDGRVHGAILVDMRLSEVEELFGGASLGKGGFLFIADARGEVVYAPVNKVVYRVPMGPARADETLVSIGGADYQVMSRRSPYTGWSTVGVFSVEETLREASVVRNWSLIIGAATMALATAAAFFFTASISRPVLELRALMKKAEEGDLSVRFPAGPADEIGDLGEGFNETIGRVQDLIGQVYHEQQSKREAELRILQEQIKPHFLYNTLDTIQWMAQEHRVDDVVTMVGSLTRLFRIGLSRGRELIPLSEELAHVESYLVIQKMRYEEKFDYRIERGEGLGGRKVLRLVLQPLVENAIYHGIKERRGKGSLLVRATAEGGDLVLEVRDDGAGMEAGFLAKLNESLAAGAPAPDGASVLGAGYGIRNVHQRARLTYGEHYGLRFESVQGAGTAAFLRLPLLDTEE